MKLDEMHDEADRIWVDKPIVGMTGWVAITIAIYVALIFWAIGYFMGATQ